MSTWAVLVAAARRAARRGACPRRSRARAAGRCSPRASSGSRLRLGRRDRRRRARGLGGAGDPARRGARLRQGGGRRDRRRDPGRVGALGVAEVPDDAVAVLVHDAARPLVSEDVIERVLAALGEGWDGAVPALPVADTIKRVDGERRRRDASARRARRGADAAGVRAPRAPRGARGRRRGATDCASLVEARGGRVTVVEGDPRLLKITTPRTSRSSSRGSEGRRLSTSAYDARSTSDADWHELAAPASAVPPFVEAAPAASTRSRAPRSTRLLALPA